MCGYVSGGIENLSWFSLPETRSTNKKSSCCVNYRPTVFCRGALCASQIRPIGKKPYPIMLADTIITVIEQQQVTVY